MFVIDYYLERKIQNQLLLEIYYEMLF